MMNILFYALLVFSDGGQMIVSNQVDSMEECQFMEEQIQKDGFIVLKSGTYKFTKIQTKCIKE